MRSPRRSQINPNLGMAREMDVFELPQAADSAQTNDQQEGPHNEHILSADVRSSDERPDTAVDTDRIAVVLHAEGDENLKPLKN